MAASSPRALRVAIDARSITAAGSGIGRVARNFLEGLAGLETDATWLVLTSAGAALPDHLRRHEGFTFIEAPSEPRDLRSQFDLPRLLRRHRARVYYAADAFGPLVRPGGLRSIITIHDLIPFTCRHMLHSSRKGRLLPLWRLWLGRQAAAATLVATDSRHSAGDIERLLGVPGAKVRVIPLAADFAPASDAGGSQADARAAADEPAIILYAGRQDPYKNVAGLVRIFDLVRQLAPMPVRLVIAGAMDPRYRDAEIEARRLGVESQVEFAGYVDDQRLVELYRRARVFAFPSFYEGFGLPPLEAMHHGLPAVVTNRTSVPEVVGDAALLVDPLDEAGFARQIVRVLTEPGVARDLAERGRRQAARFTLERQARATVELIYEAAGAGAGAGASTINSTEVDT